MAWWRGCEPVSINVWKVCRFILSESDAAARFLHLERHVDDPLLLQVLAPKLAQA
jgi:hypothetical protein